MTEAPIRIPIAKPQVGPEEQRAVAEVLASGHLAEGPRTKAFEEAFARAAGAKHAVAVANGTVALHLGLLALGVKPGDRVAVPDFTFIATANAVLMAGAKPVFVDVEPATFAMDPAKLAAALKKEKVKVVLPVHLYGHPAPMDEIQRAADKAGALMFGDAAQAVGAEYKGKRVGSTAALESFSLYATKNVMTGEGGVLTTSDADLAERLRSLRNHGRGATSPGTYDHVQLGWNYRFTDLAAAIGIEQVKKLDVFNATRRRNAAALSKGLSGVAGLNLPMEAATCRHVYHQYTVRVEGGPTARTALQTRLRAAGVGTGIYYPKPLHAYDHLKSFAHADLKVSTALAESVLSLPVHPGVTPADVDTIVDAVRA